MPLFMFFDPIRKLKAVHVTPWLMSTATFAEYNQLTHTSISPSLLLPVAWDMIPCGLDLPTAANDFWILPPTELNTKDGSRGRARDLHQAPCLPQPLQQGQGGEDARRKTCGALPQEVRQGPLLRRLQHIAPWGEAAKLVS